MTVDDVKKSELAREEQIKQAQKEGIRKKTQESTEFDRALERTQKASQPIVQPQIPSKTVTEEAIREAAKREDRHGEERRRDDEEKNGKRETGRQNERAEGRVTDQKVIAKGRPKQEQGSGGQGKGQGGGFGGSTGKRELTRILTKSGVKSAPIDLQGKFAQELLRSMKAAGASEATITQQILNKIVQYVRIGINRKGEKEIQMDMHERIFRGLKLRVISRGGKVAIFFRSADKRGREVLEKNTDAIRAALNKKGIDVDEIKVS